MDSLQLLTDGERALARARRACDGARVVLRYARALRNGDLRAIRGGAETLSPDGADRPIRDRLRRLIDEGAPEYEFTTAATVILVFHRRCLTLYAHEALDGTADAPAAG
jgi:hypothetical protein